jgi:GntR family transcriptional regulator
MQRPVPGRPATAAQETPSRRIARDLRQKIESGELATGQQLPSERTLATTYGTARNTAREAVRLLADAGLVNAQHGRGVFVRVQTPLIRMGSGRYSHRYRESGLSPFLLECAKQGKAGRFEVLSVSRAKPPAEVARQLQVDEAGESVLVRENVFWADTDPVYRVTTYIPWPTAEGTSLLDFEIAHPYGIHGTLEERGHVMTRMQESVSGRMPTAEEAGYLQMPPGVPVLDVWHTSKDQDGTAYELTRFVMRADLAGLLFDTPVEW